MKPKNKKQAAAYQRFRTATLGLARLRMQRDKLRQEQHLLEKAHEILLLDGGLPPAELKEASAAPAP